MDPSSLDILESVAPDDRARLAMGLIAGDISLAGLARFAHIHVAEAEALLNRCRDSGLLQEDGSIHGDLSTRLVADLPVDQSAAVHAAAARHLMAAGPSYLVEALRHARAAGALVPLEETVALAERGGMMSLSLRDYGSAYDLLTVACELNHAGTAADTGALLCGLAEAADGLGRVEEARHVLARAASIAEVTGDPRLLVRAAVQYALPVDWYAGDLRAGALLQRADSMPLTEEERIQVQAARAMVEMRIPVGDSAEHQVAWVTRPQVAHDLIDRALAASDTASHETRALVSLAWRTVHRAPADLARRREQSIRALDLAQQVRRPQYQVEAAVWLANDALESADRPLFDEALSVARWVAERDGNPRLRWRAYCLAAGAAHLDGLTDIAEDMRHRARAVAEPIRIPGWLGADFLLLAQEMHSRGGDFSVAESLFDSAFVDSPIGKSLIAFAAVHLGRIDTAELLVRGALRQLDPEASFLFVGTRLAETVLLLGHEDLCRQVLNVLEPWTSHVAVDSNAWWCDGPVAQWVGMLQIRLGDALTGQSLLAEAEVIARDLNDVRSMRRIGLSLGPGSQPPGASSAPSGAGLTERETRVLTLLALGATNKEIADELAFSLGTIRADTVVIYRKLSVSGRAEAAARAISLGLVPPH